MALTGPNFDSERFLVFVGTSRYGVPIFVVTAEAVRRQAVCPELTAPDHVYVSPKGEMCKRAFPDF